MVFLFVSTYLSFPLYVCMCVCVCIYIYIYIYMTVISFDRRLKRVRSDFILKLHEDGLPFASNVIYYTSA